MLGLKLLFDDIPSIFTVAFHKHNLQTYLVLGNYIQLTDQFGQFENMLMGKMT